MKRLAAFAPLLCACATTGTGWMPVDQLEHPDAARFPNDGAVIVKREIEITVDLHNQFESAWRERVYERVAILRASGIGAAGLQVNVGGDAHVEGVKGRTVAANGVVHELDPSQIFSSKGHGERAEGKVAEERVGLKLPAAEVGSVVELEYTIAHRYLPGDFGAYLDAPWPILDQTVSIVVGDPADYALRLYGTKVQPKQADRGTARMSYFELTDLPAHRNEPGEPPARLSRPRFAFHLTTIRGQQLSGSWELALAKVATELYPAHVDELSDDDLVAAPPVPSGRRLEYVARALAFVNAHTDLDTVGLPTKLRTPNEILEARGVSSAEKAVLLRAELHAAGIRSRFVLVGEQPGDFDPTFPEGGHFGNVIVSVEPQEGVPARVLVDPSCESCAVGELPTWTAHVAGRPFDAIAISVRASDRLVQPEVLQLHAERVQGSRDANEWTVELADTGDATIELVTNDRGEVGVREALTARRRTTEQRRTALETWIRERVPGAQIDELEPPTWDKTEGRAHTHAKLRAVGFAAKSGDKLVVPLALFSKWATSPKPDHARSADLYIRADSTKRDQITLHVPAGYVVDELPAPRDRAVRAVHASVEVAEDGDHVVVRRVRELHAGQYPASAYEEMASALDELASVRAESIVLRRR